MVRTILSLLIVGLVVSLARPAWAVPMLQLDIEDGTYDASEETIVIGTPTFTVRAFLRGDGDLTQAYYLSVALRPKTGPESADLGSFTISDLTVEVTGDMEYGVPPFEEFIEHDGGDLGQHDIYETFFLEHEFYFSAADATDTRNTADNPGAAIEPYAGSGGMSYYAEFEIDATLLDAGLDLHFDLYSTKLGQKKPNGDIDVDQFAPFSHDAEYRFEGNVVPEPASVAVWSMLVLGGVGVAMRRRIGAKSAATHA